MAKRPNLNERFRKFAHVTSEALGAPWAFGSAIGLVLAWGVSGPIFGFSEAWQMVINTGTTIITFLMVFIIQNTQNREARATQLKLDELILHLTGPRDRVASLEQLGEEELVRVENELHALRSRRVDAATA